jgi:hypothetical protein
VRADRQHRLTGQQVREATLRVDGYPVGDRWSAPALADRRLTSTGPGYSRTAAPTRRIRRGSQQPRRPYRTAGTAILPGDRQAGTARKR